MNAIRREELHPRAGVVEAVDLPRHHLLVLVLLVFVPVPLLTLGGLAVPFPELAQRALAPFLPFVEHSAASQQGARTLAILPALTETPRTPAGRAEVGPVPAARSGARVVETVRVRPKVKPDVQLATSSGDAAGVATIDRSGAGSGDSGGSHGSTPSAPDAGVTHAGSGTEASGEGSSSGPSSEGTGPDSGVERNLGLEQRRRIRVERSLAGRLRWLRLR